MSARPASVPRAMTIRYFALLREQRGIEQEQLTTTASTARDLYDDIARRHRFTLPHDRIGVAVNNRFCPLDQPLQEGDQVAFIPPVAGG